MSNKATAVKIDSEKIKAAIKKAGISHSEMARNLDITYRTFMRSLNEHHSLQLHQIYAIAEITGSDPRSFLPHGTSDVGKRLADALTSLKGNYNDTDRKEWISMLNLVFDFGIGDNFHKMGKRKREEFIVHMESWILFANKYFESLSSHQRGQLIDMCEAIADKMVEKSSQQ